QLARKHGVRLAAVMGHTGEITEEEIDLCRKHALNARLRRRDNPEKNDT
nr:hypothetical protein [Bdellovibrionales bacterium]